MPYTAPVFTLPEGNFQAPVARPPFTYSQPSAPSSQNFAAPPFQLPAGGGGGFGAPRAAGGSLSALRGGGYGQRSGASQHYAMGYALGVELAKRRKRQFGNPEDPISLSGDRKLMPPDWGNPGGLQNPRAGRPSPF